MTSKVFFGSVQHGNRGRFASFAEKVDQVIDKLNFSAAIDKKDKVAIKMHLGFRDGYQTIPVFFIRRIVKKIKETGGYPFITDNPTSVYNAVERGYTQETCGCPIIPIAGVKDGYSVTQEVNYKTTDTMDMAGALYDADVLVDISHVKGHNNCCFGGAIKNLALGGYVGPTRWKKIHGVEQAESYWDADKCSPKHAQKLVDSCPYGLIDYDEEEHELKINFGLCVNSLCHECLAADKDVGCLSFDQKNFAAFQELMAIATKNVLDTFEPEKRFFINFPIEITAYCDCWGIGQPVIVHDIGVLASKDIVAIEHASLDLIKEQGIIAENVPPFFKHANLDPKADLHPFERIHGPLKDPYQVVNFANQLGLGSKDYEIVEILPPEKTLEMEPPQGVQESAPTFF